jgi:hypothetical protein
MSKDSKVQKKKDTQNLLDCRKEQICSFKETMLNSIKNDTLNDIDYITKTFSMTVIANNQLERGGSSLTKDDMIFIVKYLNNKKKFDIEKIKTTTVDELNKIIRDYCNINIVKLLNEKDFSLLLSNNEKKSDQFNKNELIILLVCLFNKKISNIEKIKSTKIDDLRMIIRGLIYDIPLNEINKDLLSITNIPPPKPPKMINNDGKKSSDKLVVFSSTNDLENNSKPSKPSKPPKMIKNDEKKSSDTLVVFSSINLLENNSNPQKPQKPPKNSKSDKSLSTRKESDKMVIFSPMKNVENISYIPTIFSSNNNLLIDNGKSKKPLKSGILVVK